MTNGQVIVPVQFDRIEDLSYGLIQVGVKTESNEEIEDWKDNIHWGLVDVHGRTLLPPEYKKIQDFSEGMAQVINYGRTGTDENTNNNTARYGYIDST
ncbi:MAG TPA: WG repeat-containing protein, partial [Saprospiraceae bacterium]|nr:WG repeat-containing protein [Saprospiraceae bacterium]